MTLLTVHTSHNVHVCFIVKQTSRYVTSARTGSNVEAAFLDLVERAVAFMDQQEAAAAMANGGSTVSEIG